MKLNKKELLNDGYALLQLTKRSAIIFLKDKASVFFSLLAPIIILLLYILFLGDIQVSSLKASFPEGIPIDEKAVKAFVDSWMLAGVLSVTCITVSFSANTVMVQDKQKGVINDGLVSPVKRWVLTMGYFTANLLITLAIMLVVLIICLLYLVIGGGWYLSVGDVFGIIGVIIYSSVSSTLLSVFICSFLKTEAQHGGLVGIMSAVLGFFIGAYMPMSIMPKAAQYFSGIIPGSHSAGLFKHFLMNGALENLGKDLPSPVLDQISEYFSMKVNFFGTEVEPNIMAVYLGASIVVFLLLNVILSFRKKQK